MTLTPAGEALLKLKEACRLTAYLDVAGVLTIGWGHTGPDVLPGQTITQDVADLLLVRDTARFCSAVALAAPIATPAQHDALVCLAYNIGEASLERSTVLRLHNAGDHAGAARAFAMWNKVRVNGKLVVSAGLTRRRAEEAALYLSDSPEEQPEHTGASLVGGEKPLSQSRTVNGTAAAGASVGIGAALEGAKDFVSNYQDTFMSVLPYVQDLKWFLFAGAGAGVAWAAWARYQDRKQGQN